jgi:DNA-binding response OmpR family regulator
MSRSVLIVEDSEEVAELEAGVVRRHHATPTVAIGGADALALLHERPFNLILLDLGLPQLTGQGVLDALALDGTLSEIPVIVVSGDLDQLHETAQVIAVVAKPFEIRDLGRAMDRALRRPRAASRQSKPPDGQAPNEGTVPLPARQLH